MIKKLFYLTAVCSAFLTTSCLGGDDEPMNTIQSTCSIRSSSGNPVLYLDGGAIVYPTLESVYKLTGTGGFGSAKRAIIQFQYADINMTQDANGTVIKNAEVIGGNAIPTFDIMTKDEAMAKNVLAEDSIFALSDLKEKNIWAYGGYLNVSYNATYYPNGSGGYLIPSISAVYEQDPDNERNLDITLVLNKHGKKDGVVAGEGTILNSFDISSLSHLFPPSGFDSIRCNLHYLIKVGLNDEEQKTITKSIAVKDLLYPW